MSTSDRMKFVSGGDGFPHFSGWDGSTDGLDPVSHAKLRKSEWVVMSDKRDVTSGEAYNLPVNFQSYVNMLKHTSRDSEYLMNPLTKRHIQCVHPLDIHGEIKLGHNFSDEL